MRECCLFALLASESSYSGNEQLRRIPYISNEGMDDVSNKSEAVKLRMRGGISSSEKGAVHSHFWSLYLCLVFWLRVEALWIPYRLKPGVSFHQCTGVLKCSGDGSGMVASEIPNVHTHLPILVKSTEHQRLKHCINECVCVLVRVCPFC